MLSSNALYLPDLSGRYKALLDSWHYSLLAKLLTPYIGGVKKTKSPLLRTPWGTFKYLVLSPTFLACVVLVGLALGAGVASSLALNDLKKKETPPPAPVTKTATITASPSESVPSEPAPPSTSQAPAPAAPAPVKPVPVPTKTVTQRPVAPARPAPAPVNRRASTTLTGSCNGTLTIYASGPNASISLGGRRGGSSLSLPWNGSFAATLTADGNVSGSWNCGN